MSFFPLLDGLEIQKGEHSSVDDARAALLLYKKFAKQWEREVKLGTTAGKGGGSGGGAGGKGMPPLPPRGGRGGR